MDGYQVLVGNVKFTQRHKVETSASDSEVKRLQKEGRTAMYVAVDGQAAGVVAVADTFKEDSINSIQNRSRSSIIRPWKKERTR